MVSFSKKKKPNETASQASKMKNPSKRVIDEDFHDKGDVHHTLSSSEQEGNCYNACNNSCEWNWSFCRCYW